MKSDVQTKSEIASSTWRSSIIFKNLALSNDPSEDRSLDARVVLSVHGVPGIVVPSVALAVELAREALDLADPIGLLEELDSQTFVRVPCDMTM